MEQTRQAFDFAINRIVRRIVRRTVYQTKSRQRRRTEQYGAEFHWTPEERRQHINIIRGMRAMQNYMCTRIRRGLPFRRTPEAVDAFLDRLETECQHIESHDSDEFF